MTTTPPDAPPGPDQGPRTTRQEARDLGRLRRSTTDRHIAGVAGGLARHFDLDPLVVRVALAVLIFFGGAGLLVYGAVWLMVPEDDGHEPVVPMDDRTRSVALMGAGVLAGLALLGDSVGWVHFPWPLAIVGGIALVLLTRSRRNSTPPGEQYTAPAPPYGPPPGAYGGPAAGHGAPTSGYAAPAAAAEHPSHVPPTPPPAPVPPVAPYVPPRNPRKRGPLLFWFTMALAALGLGVLGLVDTGGLDVPPAAYPALVVATCGVMLLLGAFYGRAGGLILVGLLATIPMVAATAADKWEGERIDVTPTSAAVLDDDYRMEVGEMVIDLTEVDDLSALDGGVLELRANVGRIEVVVPEQGLDVGLSADVSGPGNIKAFSTDHGGIDVALEGEYDGGAAAPELTIDARIDVGEIEIRTDDRLSTDRFNWRNR